MQGKWLVKEAPKFRGNWSPSLPDPIINRYNVPIPTQPKPQPKAQAPKAVPVEQPVRKEKIAWPPSDAVLNILDRCRDPRSYIAKDGTCKDAYGTVIGYVNDEGQVGGPDKSYWGCITEDIIYDKDDKQIGELDPGRAYVKDVNGNTIAELENSGDCKGHDGSFIGQFVGFTYHDMQTIALYLLIIDVGMYNTIEG
ncbi:Phospholipid scramblase [Balamuthia mandrillaris]